MTKFQPNPNIHLRNVGYEYQIINGNNVVTFTGVEVCSFLHDEWDRVFGQTLQCGYSPGA